MGEEEAGRKAESGNVVEILCQNIGPGVKPFFFFQCSGATEERNVSLQSCVQPYRVLRSCVQMYSKVAKIHTCRI